MHAKPQAHIDDGSGNSLIFEIDRDVIGRLKRDHREALSKAPAVQLFSGWW